MSPFDKLFAFMTKPIVAISYACVVVLFFVYFDKPLTSYFYNLNLRASVPILSYVTRLGLGILYLPTFLFVALFFRYIHKNPKGEACGWFLFLCLIVPSTICLFLKVSLGRARPSMFFEAQQYGFYGFNLNPHYWSFPSGHTTTIMGVVMGLSIVFPRYIYPLMLTGVVVTLSRVLLTHHYVSDVLIAAYLTLIEIGLMLYLLRRKSWLAPAWRHTV